jgi:hypothetical protein
MSERGFLGKVAFIEKFLEGACTKGKLFHIKVSQSGEMLSGEVF